MIRVVPVALLLVMLSPGSSLAQLTPPAGSAGAGNSSISGIPAGPANNPTLSDPSGIGNAGGRRHCRRRRPFGDAVIARFRQYGCDAADGSKARQSACASPGRGRAPRSVRSSRARAAVTTKDRKIDSKFSICRGC